MTDSIAIVATDGQEDAVDRRSYDRRDRVPAVSAPLLGPGHPQQGATGTTTHTYIN